MGRFFFFLILFFSLSSESEADEVKYLALPQESLAAFLTLADQAQRSIDLATFIFEPCHASTQLLLEKLERKAREGVQVRILLDAVGHSAKQKKELANFFARSGIELRFYNDYSAYGPLMNLRMHVKVMTIDGTSYISGGRNISDEYFGMSTKQNWVDRDVLVRGKSATMAADSFRELWQSKMVSKAKGNGSSFTQWACAVSYTKPLANLRAYLASRPDLVAQIPERSCASVSFTSDSPEFGNPKYGPDRNSSNEGPDPYMTPMRLALKRATSSVLEFIDETDRKLEVENWGYLPYGFLSEAFENARQRRVQVRVITNEDMEAGPTFFKEAEEYAIKTISARDSKGTQKVTLVSSKGKFNNAYELTPAGIPFYLHAKTMVRDNRDVMVASFNLDGRSYSTNLESVVTMPNCPSLAADVQKRIDEIYAINAADRKAGRIPAKSSPSLLAKLFAMLSLSSL